MKYTLVKESDGVRGEMGKMKFYEILVEGDKVTVTWGKFQERWAGGQSQEFHFKNNESATRWAEQRRHEKRKKGYDLLLVA